MTTHATVGSSPTGPTTLIGVGVRCSDPISHAGLVSCMSETDDLLVLDDGEAVDVAVCAVDRLDDRSVAVIAAAHGASAVPVVVVLPMNVDADLIRLIEAGVRAIVRLPDARAEILAPAVRGAAMGEATLPGDLLWRLLTQVNRLQVDVLASRGLHLSGLTDRELDVLRLVAEGFDTGYIARKLCYSERTVKNVLQETTLRLGLRNRTHAVAYALRHGLI